MKGWKLFSLLAKLGAAIAGAFGGKTGRKVKKGLTDVGTTINAETDEEPNG